MMSILGFSLALAAADDGTAAQVGTQEQATAAAELVRLGGIIHTKPGSPDVVEVRLNGRPLANDDLRWLTPLITVTDLSMESTPIGDAGLSHLSSLTRLEWLNLYQTRLSDKGLSLFAPAPQTRAAPHRTHRCHRSGPEDDQPDDPADLSGAAGESDH